jgi:hypothetical protein
VTVTVPAVVAASRLACETCTVLVPAVRYRNADAAERDRRRG